MKYRSFLINLVLMTSIVAGFLVIKNFRSLQIWFHLHRMESAYKGRFAETPSESVYRKLYHDPRRRHFQNFKHHRDQLLKLGYYFHSVYELSNAPDSDRVHIALWEFVSAQPHDPLHPPELSWPNTRLEVLDVSTRRHKWDTFVEKYDVADFPERFMSDSGATPANKSRAAEFSIHAESPKYDSALR